MIIMTTRAHSQAQVYTDRDSDGLIEILYIEQLDSIRYNPRRCL